jgi:IS5 family transposase
LVRQCLATRRPLSTRTGREAIAPDRVLRCCIMKHLKGWSFRDLERELRSNLVYRRFTHFDAEATPHFTTFSRSFALLSPAITAEIHQRVVALACEQGAARGDKLRTDTTVVESNVHYPTDSSLWATASGCSAAACKASPPSVRTEPWKWWITDGR